MNYVSDAIVYNIVDVMNRVWKKTETQNSKFHVVYAARQTVYSVCAHLSMVVYCLLTSQIS